MKVLRRSRRLAWLAGGIALTAVIAGVTAGASAPAQARVTGIVFQSHVMASWGGDWLGDGTPSRSLYGDIKAVGNNVVQVSAGLGYHHLAVRSDGTVWAWGLNWFGEVGDGTTTTRATPVQVTGLAGVTQVAAGGLHSLALRSDGTVWAWGWNNHGQLGNGTTDESPSPVQVTGLDNVTKIAAGYYFSLALRSDGTVWAWGWNNHGQLGNFNTDFSSKPVMVAGLSHATGISAGKDHAVATANSGISVLTSVWAWGANDHGQLADGDPTFADHAATRVTGLPSYIAGISAGGQFTTVLGTDGTVWAWGDNDDGQLGSTPTGIFTVRPANTVGIGSGITQLSAGGAYVLALKSNGTVLAWGSNSFGQLGIGNTTSPVGPVQVAGLTSATQVAAGMDTSLTIHTVPYLVGL
jgi:alpha-tubulin suppressor-like RCC1 family protein